MRNLKFIVTLGALVIFGMIVFFTSQMASDYLGLRESYYELDRLANEASIIIECRASSELVPITIKDDSLKGYDQVVLITKILKNDTHLSLSLNDKVRISDLYIEKSTTSTGNEEKNAILKEAKYILFLHTITFDGDERTYITTISKGNVYRFFEPLHQFLWNDASNALKVIIKVNLYQLLEK